MSASIMPAALDTRRLPGDRDLWVFIFAELVMFGAFFVAYIVYRIPAAAAFNASQIELDTRLGVLNTLLLITSSWALISAIEAVRHARMRHARSYLSAAIGLGIGFIGVKVVEYGAKLSAGITLTTDNFFMFYFCLTGIHLLHVIAGTIILVVLWHRLRGGHYSTADTRGMEAGASYWHMVDLLWMFLFALLYLLR